MTETINDVPRYRRDMPDGWDHLISETETLLTGHESFSTLVPEDVSPVYDMAGMLDNEKLDTNRYYGLGLVMCGVARALQMPEIRQKVTDDTATKLACGYLRMGYHSGLRPGDLHLLADAYSPLFDITKGAVGSLPLAERVVTENLVELSVQRREQIQPSTVSDTPIPKTKALGEILHNNLAALHVSVNAMAAITLVLTRVLSLPEDGYRHLGDAGSNKWSPIDPDYLSRLDVRKAAKQTGLMRLDEFISMVHSQGMFSVEDDTVHFKGDQLTRPPCNPKGAIVSLTQKPVLHRNRLTCPAVQVPGLVEMMSQFVPEVIVRAQMPDVVARAKSILEDDASVKKREVQHAASVH